MKYRYLGIVIIIFLLGLGTGYSLTPEYSIQNTQMKQTHDLGPADRWVDLRYIDGVIAHHLSAIYLLEQAQAQSSRPEIQALASAVIAADKAGIESLYARKKEWYGNTRSIQQFQKVNLGTNDENFDLRLLNALIKHHEEAIATAQDVSTKSTRNETLNTANEITHALSANALQLKAWRKEWYELE